MPRYDRFEMGRAIEKFIINPRYRLLLRLKLCEGMTYEEVAEAVSYSTQHVKHIVKTYREFLISQL